MPELLNFMHANEREAAILKHLEATGFLSFREMDKVLPASAATLRRDLDRLEGQGKIVRVRGGAKLAGDRAGSGSLSGVPFNENVSRHSAEKAAIGRAAAALCRNGEAVIIDGGSTTLQMCPHIESLGLHVLTNSLHIVSALQRQATTRISIPAGGLFREQNIVLSPYEDDGMSAFRASKLFMGAAAVGPHGPMQADVLLVQAERRLLSRTNEVILLVDSSKFDGTGGHLICGLDEVDVLITDASLRPEHREMLERSKAKVIIAQ